MKYSKLHSPTQRNILDLGPSQDPSHTVRTIHDQAPGPSHASLSTARTIDAYAGTTAVGPCLPTEACTSDPGAGVRGTAVFDRVLSAVIDHLMVVEALQLAIANHQQAMEGHQCAIDDHLLAIASNLATIKTLVEERLP